MNWVGGSRNRLVMKSNAKKQREFFEKRKMQQRLKNLGITLPASPPGAACSVDLVNLLVVNQIAAKKESKEPPKVAVLGSCKGGSKHRRKKSLVLPMSPCSPSQLLLQGMTERKHVIPQGFKCHQLPPFSESSLSNSSASHYLQPIDRPLSPLSSISSTSSGQEIFPLEFSLQQKTQNPTQPSCSPATWDSLRQELAETRDMTGNTLWSHGSNLYFNQLETPTAAQVLFEGPEPDKTEIRHHSRHAVSFSLSHSEDNKNAFDFMLNQSISVQQFEEDVFRGLSNEEYEREGISNSKIYLKDKISVKSSTPQTVPASEAMEDEFHNCTDTILSGSGHTIGPLNGCDCLPSYLSSDSSNEEECCQPCLYSYAPSNMDQACPADNPNSHQDSQEKSQKRQPMYRSSTPLSKSIINLIDDQEFMENMPCPEKACQNNHSKMENSSSPRLSHRPLALTESCRFCKCKKASRETQDAGTQTVKIFTTKMRNASTQCNSMLTDTGFSLYLPPVDVSVQLPATRRQTDTVRGLNTYTGSPGESGGGKHMPRSKNSEEHTPSGRSNIRMFSNIDSKAITPARAFLDAPTVADNKGKENGNIEGEKENVPLMKGCSDGVREEFTPSAKVNTVSAEDNTFQEIADILLLLKQRKTEA